MEFLVVLFFLLVYAGWKIGKSFGNSLFKDLDNNGTFVDKTTHIQHHYHDNRSVHVDGKEFKNLKK